METRRDFNEYSVRIGTFDKRLCVACVAITSVSEINVMFSVAFDRSFRYAGILVFHFTDKKYIRLRVSINFTSMTELNLSKEKKNPEKFSTRIHAK